MISIDDTIAAIASAPGPAARGIIRVSGPHSQHAVEAVFQPRETHAWRTQKSARQFEGRLILSSENIETDCEAYLWPGTRSYTGQPLVELHTIGCPPILQAILDDLLAGETRAAHAGEFTLRAFLAQRIDLVQAEAVLGVIDAADHRELDLALSQLAGGISSRIAEARNVLIELLADLEAGLDFVEEDIEFVESAVVIDRLESIQEFINQLLQQSRDRMRSTATRRIVLAGQPNAGKSTLFNRLIGEHAALVSTVEGTTRDYLSAQLNWSGPDAELVDTAGWEPDSTGIISRAQDFSRKQWERADLIIWCRNVDMPSKQTAMDEAFLHELRAFPCPTLLIHTKSDQLVQDSSAKSQPLSDEAPLAISAHTGQGIAELQRCLADLLQNEALTHRSLIGGTAARCRDSLRAAGHALSAACSTARAQAGDELVAFSIREALDHLGHIVGAVYTEDLLDHIFSRFCIGK